MVSNLLRPRPATPPHSSSSSPPASLLPSPFPPSSSSSSPFPSPFPSSSSINHSLFHCTTRIPLYTHPSLWSQAHLVALRIALDASSPPTQKTPTTRGFVSAPLLGKILKPKGLNYTPFADIMCLLSSTIASIDPHPQDPIFPIFYNKLELQIGSIITDITPRMYVEHANQRTISIPFLAYSDPEHRDLQHAITSRSRCSPPLAIAPEDIVPSDVAVLLAMAQKQYHIFPTWSVYHTYLLSPNYSGTYVHVLLANVTGSYLQCLRDPWLPLTERLNITRSVLAVSEGGFLDVVKGILEGAPRLPGGNKSKRVKTSL